jgi:anti-sigma B factor antagonist
VDGRPEVRVHARVYGEANLDFLGALRQRQAASRNRRVVIDQPPVFDVQRAPLTGAPGVIVRGEVDLNTAGELTAALEEAIRESVGVFILDLDEVEFLDSSGVSVIMQTRAVLGREDRTLAVVCPPGPPRRALEVSGVADVLALYDSRDEVASLQPVG